MNKFKKEYNQDEDDQVISEGSEYSPKSEFSKPRLVEEAVKKCLLERAKEMREGYYNYKFDQNGMPLKTWIPDQREVFNSTMEALKNLLAPEIKRNDAYKKVQVKIEEELNDLFDTYSYQQLEPHLNEQQKVIYKKSDFKYIPKKGERLLIQKVGGNGRIVATELVGGWDRKVDFYLDEMVKLNDKLFSAINELLDGLNYFKSGLSF